MSKMLVTDTHPLTRYFCGPKSKLSRKVFRAFDDAIENKTKVIYVPATVLWEISILISNGDIKLSLPFSDWVTALFKHPMILSAPFDEQTAIQYHQLKFTTDPFDKAIVATALQFGLPLITNDSVIHDKKPCKLFWD